MVKEKKKRTSLWVTLCIIGFVVLLLLGSLIFVAVTMENLSTSIEQSKTEVIEAYKGRNEAVAELVQAIKPMMSAETALFTELENAQSELAKATDTKALSDANIKVDTVINKLIYVMISKHYYLYTSDNKEIESKIDGARNRIVTESTDYNTLAKDYNFAVQNFPGNFISKIAGHEVVELIQIVNYSGTTN